MFMSDVLKKEECRNEAVQELRKLGIKCRPKKPKQHVQNMKPGPKVFKVPLGLLPTETVTLKTGQQIPVPKLVHHLCSLILAKVSTEGIFRKEGSRGRQTEMKVILNAGGLLNKSDHVVDVAVILKTFLRELPEPLIPYGYHELFLRCALSEASARNVEAILLACLLLPLEYLNTLTYLMQFFHQVADQSKKNKMNAYNLAVVIGPSVFPIEEKLTPHNVQIRTTKICDIIQILIENASNVGVLPESIIERLGSNGGGDVKKKKRRSGSLTRMFNGLKKIVGGKSVEENHNVVTPDLLLTPVNNNTMKKRRLQTSGISNKKKKELLNKLPDNVLLTTPFTPCRTPVSMDLSGAREKHFKGPNEFVKEKKSQWFLRSKSVKNLRCEDNNIYKNSTNTKTALERRWSAIGQTNNAKKTKKRNSFAASSANHKDKIISNVNDENLPEPDYIRVSKIEYEAIKNRVSAMERRISIELESVQSQIKTENENNANVEVDTNIEHVQTVYEQTLVQSEHLSPTTDQLAKRLSRELKIRRSADQKIIRSPSARKIGGMRRKSLEKSSSKLTRHQSWHVPSKDAIPRVNLKRGKPNTVLTGLPVNRPDSEVSETKEIKRTRSSSVGDQSVKTVSCNLSGSSSDTWVSAEGFFATMSSNSSSNSFNDRASLARLRSQNAGMVLAKAKLFDKLHDSDSSSSSSLVRSIPRAKVNTKIGSHRNIDSRLSYRVRTLKCEERRLHKKSMSPKRRNGCLSQKQKLQLAKQYLESSAEKNSDKENIPDNFNNVDKHLVVPLKDCNRIDGQKVSSPKYSTPRAPPHIKKSLNVKSPKRLCRTPIGVDRSTPLRVLKTPICNHI